MTKSRGYCFTINNWDEDDLHDVLDMFCFYDCQYLIIGFEKGKKGTEHLQCYIYYPNAIAFKSIKKMIPRAHIEATKGSPEDNFEYCSKEGDFLQYGELPIQGRAKWDSIVKAMNDPMSAPHIFNQYRKGYREMQNLLPISDKDRQLSFVPEHQVVRYMQLMNKLGYSVCYDLDRYDGEQVLFHKLTMYNFEFDDLHDEFKFWAMGVPQKRKFGYEFRRFDPDAVIFVTHNINQIIEEKYCPYIETTHGEEFLQKKETYEESLRTEVEQATSPTSEKDSKLRHRNKVPEHNSSTDSSDDDSGSSSTD